MPAVDTLSDAVLAAGLGLLLASMAAMPAV